MDGERLSTNAFDVASTAVDAVALARQVKQDGFTEEHIRETVRLVSEGAAFMGIHGIQQGNVPRHDQTHSWDKMGDTKKKWIEETAKRWVRRTLMPGCDKAKVRSAVREMYELQNLSIPDILFADSPLEAQDKIDGLRHGNIRGNNCILLHYQLLEKNWGKVYQSEMISLESAYRETMNLVLQSQGPWAPSGSPSAVSSVGTWRNQDIEVPQTSQDRFYTWPLWPKPVKDVPPHYYAMSTRHLGFLYFIMGYGPKIFKKTDIANKKSAQPWRSKDEYHIPRKLPETDIPPLRDFQIANLLIQFEEAGPFMSWFFKDTVIISRPPKIHLEPNRPNDPPRLHNEFGPAVRFPDGQKSYWWKGTQVPENLITAPTTIPVREILGEQNLELRRAMIDRVGYDRILEDVDAHTISEDETGELVEADLGDDGNRKARFCRVKDVSSDRIYMIRTDPSVKTCKDGLARSVKLSPEDYDFVMET